MREAIQLIQMRSLPTPPSSPMSSPPPQAVKGLFCPQRVMSAWPIENSRRVLRDECPGWAQWPQFEYHADICQIGAPNKRKEGYSAPIQACCYFISRKFASSIYSFCSFSSVYGVWNTLATWQGRPFFLDRILFLLARNWNTVLVFVSDRRFTRTGPTTTSPSQDTSVWSRTCKQTSRTECCWLRSYRS